MHKKNYKKVMTFALILSMLMSAGSAAAFADDAAAEGEAPAAEAAAEEAPAEEESGGKSAKLEDPITEAEALSACVLAAENDKYKLYLDNKKLRLCLQVKSSGKCWWTSPINAGADTTPVDEKGTLMKKAPIDQAKSSIAINVGDLRQEKRTELPAPAYSSKAKTTMEVENGGAKAEYDYSSNGVKLTVHYELTERGLHMYVKTDEIIEENPEGDQGKVLTKLIMAPYMGAVSGFDENGNPAEGYMIVPDGSGAVIRYNNGKGNYPSYQQKVYGMDYTAVPLNAPKVTEQAYLPVMATVQGNNGLVMVATEGNANVYVNAQVSGQNKQAFNNCYFMFETRSTDEYYMSGSDSTKIMVFEKYGIKTPQFGVEFMPVENSGGVSPADCAAVYRDYLETTQGLTEKTQPDSSALYIDTYGSVLKKESILGIPVVIKKKLTTFKQASKIAGELTEAGASNIVMNCNDWTKDTVRRVVADNADSLGKLGSTNDLKNLSSGNITAYGSINNFTMEKSSWGYGMLTDTAIRVSSSYSRQSRYSPAFGVAVKGVSPALIAPGTYQKIFDKSLASFTGKGVKNMGYGDWSVKLVSDFSRKSKTSRNDTMNIITKGYSDAVSKGQSIIAAGANSYILPYVDAVTDIPVYSSGYTITDEDIPFYQMVIHGVVPYSSKAINASSNTDLTFMRALAAGSDMNYDMIYEAADELAETEDDIYYYTHYSGWIDTAGNQARIAKEILAPVSDYKITGYEEDGDTIRTTYSKDGAADVVIEVDLADFTVRANGQFYDLANEGAVDKGGVVG